jgi:hypothetical protein
MRLLPKRVAEKVQKKYRSIVYLVWKWSVGDDALAEKLVRSK